MNTHKDTGHKQSRGSCLPTEFRRYCEVQPINRLQHLIIVVDGLAQLTSNEYLVLAGTLHGIHAITSRLSPVGPSSGAQVIEGETFKMTILLTATGVPDNKEV
jgi:hypothetical protein